MATYSSWKIFSLVILSVILLSTTWVEAKKKAPGGMGGMGGGGKYRTYAIDGV